MRQCLLLSVALLSAGLYSPEIAYSDDVARESEETQIVVEPNAKNRALNIEERRMSDDKAYSYERTFAGYAEEIIVFEIEKGDDVYALSDDVALYSPTGDKLYPNYHPDFANLDYFGERYMTFVLPETGEYKFVLEVDNVWGEPNSSYLLRIRDADYYEQLMITAENKLRLEQYEEALPLLATAADYSPELPAAYLARLMAYLQIVSEMPDVQERMQTPRSSEEPGTILDALYETFKTLDDEIQTLALNDLRRVEQIYTNAIENDGYEMRDESELELYRAISDFLETGVHTETTRLLIFGSSL